MFPVWILLTLLPILGGAERFNCKGRILGAYYADAKSGCKAFHVCVRVAGGGIRDFRFFCPPGTLFHQEAQTCTDWGDDDPLACPADIYDGQFDLYRIGSGFDTKKLSPGNRDDEAEFGLQRAETGDRRLSQKSVAPNKPDSDLRAAHSSDFFSGQRDRGRDESASTAQSAPASPQPQPYQRQSFRRPTTQRTFPTTPRTFSTTQRTFPTTQFSSPVPTASPQPSNRPQHDIGSKRKLVRKRPIYVSTKAPSSTLPPNTQANYPEPPFQTQQVQQNFIPQQSFNSPQNVNAQQSFNSQQNSNNQQAFNRRIPSSSKSYSTTPNVPPQYREFKDEYVEVSRVTPKPTRYFQSNSHSPSTPFPLSTQAQKYNNKKDGLVELYNYDAQSTPGLNAQDENRPFKVRNSFSVADAPRDTEFARVKNYNNARDASTTNEFSFTTRGFPTTTPTYKNFNSVSYEPEKNNFVSYSKQSNFNNYPSSTTAPTTTIYTTPRPEPPQNLNTVAYDTNIGFFAQPNDFAGNDEDDGQYHPPEGEDDGQYRPELYDRELLAGAHSLNIAASGNRLPEDRKAYSKTQSSPKSVGQTAAPRPFRPAPSPTAPPTTSAPDTVYTTTPQAQTINTQRTFDYVQTYTTTSRPVDYLGAAQTIAPNDAPARPTTTAASRSVETRPPRPTSRAPSPSAQPSSAPPRPTTRHPHFANPVNNKEDNSYDYAYYDSDLGFSEFDQIEEFAKTNKKIS